MRVLVTGATGFIGSHLVDSLVSKGHNVKVLLRKTSETEYLENLDVDRVYGDVRDKKSVKHAVEDVDIVYHLGAIFNFWMPIDLIFDVNVNGTKNILETCLNSDIENFVHCSSIGVLGPTGATPANEKTPYNPTYTAYTQSKYEAEKMALTYYTEQKLPVSIIRPDVVYGPRCFYGVYDGIIATAEGKLKAILGHGNNYLSLIHVSDVVHGLELAAEKKKVIGKVYIITDGEAHTLNELFITMARCLDIDPPDRHAPIWIAKCMAFLSEMKARITGGIPRFTRYSIDFMKTNHIYDISKAKQELGYEPKIGLEEGMKQTVDFYRKNGYIR